MLLTKMMQISGGPPPVSYTYFMGRFWRHSICFVDKDGISWMWGSNPGGQFGNNTTGTTYSSPISILGGYNVKQNAVNGYTYGPGIFLLTDGTVRTSGQNGYGELGTNNLTNRSSPVSVVGGHSFASIGGSCFEACILLKADGSVWGWGRNQWGQFGDNSTTDRSSPISGASGHLFTKIFASAYTVLGLKSDGTAWGWGYNGYAQIGDNSTTSRSSPTSVVGGHSFIDIGTSGEGHSVALKADGSAWGWGENADGQIGDGTTDKRSSPVSVVGGHSFTKIKAGEYHTIALKADGSVWCWGRNPVGELGDNSTTYRSSPVSVVGGRSFIDIAAGTNTSHALRSDGQLFSWGYNSVGQLGTNNGVDYSSPVSVCRTFVIQ